MSEYLRRMILLADEFFATKNDPQQLDVTPEVMESLEQIHPATLSEEVEGDGPVVWILLIPTSEETKVRFLKGSISEKEVLDESLVSESYTSLYLCSALVLPEYRNTGRAFRTAKKAIEAIMKDHPIASLYTWSFSQEGKGLAKKLAGMFNLPLEER